MIFHFHAFVLLVVTSLASEVRVAEKKCARLLSKDSL